jgi:hypothetical protein
VLPWILHSHHLQHFLSFVLHVTVCQKKETDCKPFHAERKNKRQTSRQLHLSSPRSTTVSVCVCVCVWPHTDTFSRKRHTECKLPWHTKCWYPCRDWLGSRWSSEDPYTPGLEQVCSRLGQVWVTLFQGCYPRPISAGWDSPNIATLEGAYTRVSSFRYTIRLALDWCTCIPRSIYIYMQTNLTIEKLVILPSHVISELRLSTTQVSSLEICWFIYQLLPMVSQIRIS